MDYLLCCRCEKIKFICHDQYWRQISGFCPTDPFVVTLILHTIKQLLTVNPVKNILTTIYMVKKLGYF